MRNSISSGPTSSGGSHLHHPPPFLPLEEDLNGNVMNSRSASPESSSSSSSASSTSASASSRSLHESAPSSLQRRRPEAEAVTSTFSTATQGTATGKMTTINTRTNRKRASSCIPPASSASPPSYGSSSANPKSNKSSRASKSKSKSKPKSKSKSRPKNKPSKSRTEKGNKNTKTKTKTKTNTNTEKSSKMKQQLITLAQKIKTAKQKLTTKQAGALCVLACVLLILLYDSYVVPKSDRNNDAALMPRIIKLFDRFLNWVQHNPTKGLCVFSFVIAIGVICMIPVGTPLTLGCGYIYKHVYGWGWGCAIATLVSMGGSAIGAICCFLLGRYLMRDQVRKWIKTYPIFDAIDVATAEHGLRIMGMLYLTPILPLGPVSYMCGTTSMSLTSFAVAKIAALPLMLLYVLIGASTGTLLAGGDRTTSTSNNDSNNGMEMQDAALAAEAEAERLANNPYVIISGIVLSFTMISCITYVIRKQLNTILERQQKHKPGEIEPVAISMGGDDMNNNEEFVMSGDESTADKEKTNGKTTASAMASRRHTGSRRRKVDSEAP